jgi:hypothetical protein
MKLSEKAVPKKKQNKEKVDENVLTVKTISEIVTNLIEKY